MLAGSSSTLIDSDLSAAVLVAAARPSAWPRTARDTSEAG